MSTEVAAPAGTRWSRQHACCVVCGKTDSPHLGSGVCKRCYQAKWTLHKRAMERAAARRAEQQEEPAVSEHNGTEPEARHDEPGPATLVAVAPAPAQATPAPEPLAAPILRPRHVATFSTYQLRCPNCGDLLVNAALKTALFRPGDLPVGRELTCIVCDARWRIGRETVPGARP